MPYIANISRSNPILFVFLLDQSGSMSGAFGGAESGISKAQGIADTINRLLSNLVIRGSVGDQVRDYCEVAVLGYGGKQGVMPAFSGQLAGKEIVRISEIAVYPSRIENRTMKLPDGAGGLIDTPTKFPIWFEPTAESDTPMTRAFQRAYDLVSRWITNHPNSFPPIVINITDGEATDGDPTPYAQKIKSLQTDDGNVLLFNCFISSSVAEPLLFPDSVSIIKEPYGKKMFEMSSTLPLAMTETAKQQGLPVSNTSKGFAYQADLREIIQFLDIGTRPQQIESVGSRPVSFNTQTTYTLFGDKSVVVVDTSSEITLITSETQKLTPAFLSQIVSPYIVAIADIQKVIDEIRNNSKNEVVVRSITQNSPISVSLDGASEAIKTVQDNVVRWRRENAKILAQQQISENEVAIEVLKAETLERRANAAKSRAEAEKFSAEADKQRQETEKIRLENEKTRIEIERAKVQLALDILDRIDPNIPATEKISHVVKLLSPLGVVAFSKVELSVGE